MDARTITEKPRQSLASLWNISFGFFGIQIGFALQTANMSRIFQSLGSSLDDLPALWIAAPLTGLLVQPIVGHLSDRTWLGRLGRRRPYFVGGAILAALSLVLMPLSTQLLMAAVLLWALDASLNITMEPFRAFVGDMLRKDQHTAGYAVQTAFIGAGAVLGSIFPYALDKWGVSNVAGVSGIPETVKISFWVGGAALFLAVLWTVLTTKEYSPVEMAAFGESADHPDGEQTIRALDFPSWTVLRPVFFMENLLSPWFKPYIEQGTLAIGMKPETRLQMIAVQDIGKYGLRAFERHEELNGRAIDIAGDALTGPEMAAILSEVTGRDIGFHSVPIEQVRQGSEEFAIMLEWFDAVGYDADIERTSAEFGVRPTRFREWAAAQDWGGATENG